MYLVDHQQIAVALEFPEVKIGSRGDGLAGRDIALQPTAGIRRVLRGTDCHGMAQGSPPARVGEGLLRLQAKAITGHDPAEAIDHAGFDEPGGSNDRQQAFPTARGDRGEDIGHLRRTRGNRLGEAGNLALMGSKWAGQHRMESARRPESL